MLAATDTTGIGLEVTPVAWEPCTEFRDDPDAADGCCAGCGWAPDDHERKLASTA